MCKKCDIEYVTATAISAQWSRNWMLDYLKLQAEMRKRYNPRAKYHEMIPGTVKHESEVTNSIMISDGKITLFVVK